MSGIDGAVKLNKIPAPSKITETETSVSAFGLPAEPVKQAVEEVVEQVVEEVVEQPVEVVEKPIFETVVETIKQPINAEESPVEVSVEKVVDKTPVKRKKKGKISDFDLSKEFDKAVAVIKTAYDKVFSKSPSFKPEFGETVGDLIFYLSSKLRKINCNLEFDKVFNLQNHSLLEKYVDGYIPLCIKLAVWCDSKNLLSISEDLLYEISSVYKKCAEQAGVDLTEIDVTLAFVKETDAIFNK